MFSPQKFAFSISNELWIVWISRLNCSLQQVVQNTFILRTFMINIALTWLLEVKHIKQYWQRIIGNVRIQVCIPFWLKSLLCNYFWWSLWEYLLLLAIPGMFHFQSNLPIKDFPLNSFCLLSELSFLFLFLSFFCIWHTFKSLCSLWSLVFSDCLDICEVHS